MKSHHYTSSHSQSRSNSTHRQIPVWCIEGVFAALWLSKSGICLRLWFWLGSDVCVHMKVESRTLLSWALRARASNSCLIRADFSCSNWVMRSLFSVTSWDKAKKGKVRREKIILYYWLCQGYNQISTFLCDVHSSPCLGTKECSKTEQKNFQQLVKDVLVLEKEKTRAIHYSVGKE